MKAHQNRNLSKVFGSVFLPFIVFPFKIIQMATITFCSLVISMRIACVPISVSSASQNCIISHKLREEFRRSSSKKKNPHISENVLIWADLGLKATTKYLIVESDLVSISYLSGCPFFMNYSSFLEKLVF